MLKREPILKRINSPEDRLLVSKLLDRAEFSEKTGRPAYTDFLDPRQQGLLEKAFGGVDIEYEFYGGYVGAERAIAIFRPDFYEPEDDERDACLRVLNLRPNRRDGLTHRDYLGSLMGLGIKREKTGDIIVGEDVCSIIVLREIADYISGSLTKVGNTGVAIETAGMDAISAPEPKVREIKVTVASLRLDCVAAPGFGMSRSKAAEFIRAGRLSLNWEETENPDRIVKEGDVLSIRGKGRVVVETVGGRTRKDRIGVVLKRFV